MNSLTLIGIFASLGGAASVGQAILMLTVFRLFKGVMNELFGFVLFCVGLSSVTLAFSISNGGRIFSPPIQLDVVGAGLLFFGFFAVGMVGLLGYHLLRYLSSSHSDWRRK